MFNRVNFSPVLSCQRPVNFGTRTVIPDLPPLPEGLPDLPRTIKKIINKRGVGNLDGVREVATELRRDIVQRYGKGETADQKYLEALNWMLEDSERLWPSKKDNAVAATINALKLTFLVDKHGFNSPETVKQIKPVLVDLEENCERPEQFLYGGEYLQPIIEAIDASEPDACQEWYRTLLGESPLIRLLTIPKIDEVA